MGGEEDDGVNLPSAYTKPIIAVRPTMMSSESSEMPANDHMNIEKVESMVISMVYF